MPKKSSLLTVGFITALLLMFSITVYAEAPTRDTRSWTSPDGTVTITFSTPETYSSCDSLSDRLYTEGVPSNWSLNGWVRVEYVLPGGGRELVPGGHYDVNQNGNLDLTISYPPVADWPVTDPSTIPPLKEIHVDMSISVYDADGDSVTWVGGDLSGAPGTLGPGGQDWDVFCHQEPDPTPTPPADPGTGTPGYWKNHPEAWPVTSITIGGVSYTREQAIAFMQTSGGGDKTYTMFNHLVSAKLNVLIGNESSCVDQTIADADAWMATYGPVGSNVKASSSAWQNGGSTLATTLDNYNNGLLCAPHRN